MPVPVGAPAWLSARSTEERAVAALRLVLGAAALAAVWIDPPAATTASLAALYALLGAHVAYAAALHAAAWLARPPPGFGHAWIHWIDVAWVLALVTGSGGSSSPFFVLFFFPILVASFRSGMRAGLATTAASAALFTAAGALFHPVGHTLELNRFVLRPVYLLLFGAAISSRGGIEALLRERLALLKEIGRLSNPRLGTDRTIAASLERLRAFYDADDCLLVTTGRGTPRLRRATREDPERGRREDPLPAELADLLLALPPELALVYAGDRRLWWARAWHEADVVHGAPAAADPALRDGLASWFAPASFVTVPVLARGRPLGRLYVASARARLRTSDVEFLLQVIDCLLPLLENIRLIDRLAASAAADERRSVARDVHDSIVQPIIGVQLGLAALRQQLDAAAADGADPAGALRSAGAKVARLVAFAEAGVADVRGLVARLHGEGGRGPGYAAGVRSYAARFAELTGVDVDVAIEGGEELETNDRLAAELFQLLREALSNVRRHTESKRVAVRITAGDAAITLVVENDGPPERAAAPFTPRSITERAESLQGWAVAEPLPAGGARVTVTIPL